MNKIFQIILLPVVVAFATGARLSILGWLFIIGVVTVLFFGVFHLIIHFRAMNYFTKKEPRVIVIFLLSHILFLFIFLFQFDFDDSKTYSVVGYVFGSNTSYIIKNSLAIVPACIAAYLVVSFLIIKGYRKEGVKGASEIYKFTVIAASILGCFFFKGVLSSYKHFQAEKKVEESGVFSSISRALKNPNKVISIIITQTNPKIKEIPPSIFKLPNLKVLDLREQDITVIPEALSTSPRLEVLNLLGNEIKEIPASICSCENLRELRVGGDIDSIPNCLKK